MMCNEDMLRCSACEYAWHKHLVIFITSIQGLGFFTIFSTHGHLWHFVPSTVGAKFNYFKSLLALIKYAVLTEEVLLWEGSSG